MRSFTKIRFQKINYVDLLKYIWVTVYFPPMIFSVWPQLAMLNKFYRYLSLTVSICIILRNLLIIGKKVRVNIVILQAFLLWLLLCTIVSDLNGVGSLILSEINIYALYLYISDAKCLKKERIFLWILSLYLVCLCLGNFCSQIIYGSKGIYRDYTLSWQEYFVCGNGNSFIFPYLMCLGVLSLYQLFAYHRLKIKYSWIYIVLLYSMSLANSSTGFMVVLFFDIICIFSIKAIREFVNKHIRIILFIVLTLTLWFLVFSGWKSDYVQNFIYDFVGESTSYLARGYIWNNAINMIALSPIFGYGTANVSLVYNSLGILSSAHNSFLQVALYGGVPALILFVVLIYRAVSFKSKKMANIHNSQSNTDIIRYFTIAIIGLFVVVFMFEQNPLSLYFFFFVFWGMQEKGMVSSVSLQKYNSALER